MYEKCTPAQQNGLAYGSKLRCVGAIGGLLGNYRQSELNPFTQAEMDTIERICQDAKYRAKAKFEETQKRLADTEASRRPETEHRQYTGK